MSFYLQNLGIVNALGCSAEAVLHNMLAGQAPLRECDWVMNKTTFIAPVDAQLLPVPAPLYPWRSRNLQLALTAIEQIRPAIQAACDAYGADRIAVVTGTSTSGIGEGEAAIAAAEKHGQRPADYHYRQ